MQTYTNYNFDYKEYKKSTHKKSNYSLLILLALIVSLMIIAFVVKPASKQAGIFYFVRLNSYLTYKEANKMSSELQGRGGAGYIHFDGRYHVLIAYYASESEAMSVVNNLKNEYPTVDIFNLEIKQYRSKKYFSHEQNKAVVNLIKTTDETINNLYSQLLQHEKNEINTSELSINLSNIIKDYKDMSSEYKSKLSNKKASTISTLEKLDKIENSLNNIKSNINEKYYTKYELVNIIFNYYSLLSSL